MGDATLEDRTAILDARRSRALFKYLSPASLIPGGPPKYSDDTPSISSGLVPLCELVAIRCKSPKVLLNVMDKDTMYFLSDASAPASESDIEIHEDPVIRACSGAVPLEGRVCELTIKLRQTSNSAPMFVVKDLSNSKFSHLDVVKGPPFYRFYAGTPITTRDGVAIGSLAFMDTRVRDGLTHAEERCLSRTAAQAMIYLETNRQAIEGRRAMQLARSLEFFIAGKATLVQDAVRPGAQRLSTYGLPTPLREQDTAPTSATAGRKLSFALASIGDEPESEDSEDSMKQRPESELTGEPRTHSHILGRAANLLREGFGGLGEDGVVLFASTKNRSSKASFDRTIHAEVVATSLPSSRISTIADLPSLALTTTMLTSLIQQYSRGHSFILDESAGSSSEDDGEDALQRSRRKSRKAGEIRALRAAFPGANQLLFSPLWDADTATFSHAVFVVNTAEDRSLSPTTELPFLKSFCSSVGAEISRVDFMKADRQKSDFVGTMSHEMRSPLHGILASAEFIADTELTSYQQSLVETVQSCGRTLLDTINHVLDFSKINSYRKTWAADNKRTRALGNKKRYNAADEKSVQGMPALLQLTSVVDIGVVVEEVVDNLVLGQSFTSGIDITDMSKEARGRGTDVPNKTRNNDVHVVIDIQAADWAFITQPGAVRRIVLNLVGNALKYTAKGQVSVRLELSGDEKHVENAMVLSVTDSGRGISPKFLNSLIFVPFAQENVLAPGTGLGLSIVHSIVTMLGGSIDIQSEVGIGTTARVTIPLTRPLSGQTSTAATPQSGNTVTSQDDSITLLQSHAGQAGVALFRPTAPDDEQGNIISRYLEKWYGLDLTDQAWDADIVISREVDLQSLIKLLTTRRSRERHTAILVLSSVAYRHDSSHTQSLERQAHVVIEWISNPVGPYKLARNIQRALHRVQQESGFPEVEGLAPIIEQPTPFNTAPVSTQNRFLNITEDLQEMDLNVHGERDAAQIVQASEWIAVSQTSQHAQKAISSPKQSRTSMFESSKTEAFPFPAQDPQVEQQGNALKVTGDAVDELTPMPAPAPKSNGTIGNNKGNSNGVDPHVLVVDDNRINSSLLSTFLTRKRKYTKVECAENGQEAVDAFTNASGAHQIIFMDISMPIMDGFQATRVIRDLEKNQSNEHESAGAMIVALTGLASARDQAEGFEAGCDMWLTKPVSLKAVGDLLNNWELHQRMLRNEKPAELAQRVMNGMRSRAVSGAVAGEV